MFDSESEVRKVTENDQPSRVNSRADINKTIVIGASAIGTIVVILVLAILCMLFFGSQKAEDCA